MRVFKTKPFARFTAHEGIEDATICEAICQAEAGLIDADLGGGVIKLRIARKGQGQSGGFRSIVLFRQGERAFFAYGFAKSDRDNIRRDEVKAFRKLADTMLELDDLALAAAVKNGTITEIRCHGEAIQERRASSRP
jgi:hypothetical protein